MPPDSKILIIEMIVSDHPRRELPELLDIQMLATMSGGKERTRSEFQEVLDQAGFAVTRIIRTIAPLALIEAKPKV
jgi:acetylornithine deacetylase/succinyl-diaminopimelate desuccinylase-like protein